MIKFSDHKAAGYTQSNTTKIRAMDFDSFIYLFLTLIHDNFQKYRMDKTVYDRNNSMAYCTKIVRHNPKSTNNFSITK